MRDKDVGEIKRRDGRRERVVCGYYRCLSTAIHGYFLPATLVTCACRDAEIRDSLVPPGWEEEINSGRVCVWLRIIYAIRAMWSHGLFNNMKPLFEEQRFKGPVPTARSKSARCHGKGSQVRLVKTQFSPYGALS